MESKFWALAAERGAGFVTPAQADSISGTGFGPTIVFEGDSRTAQSIDGSQGYTCYGPVSWARALSRTKFKAVTLAVSGNTSETMQTRKAAVQALKPWMVVRWIGVNDISTGTSGATAASRIIDCATSDIAGGAEYVVLVLETGFQGWNATPVAQQVALNNALIEFAKTNRKIRIVDSLSMVVDYTAATQVPITYLAGSFADGLTHPSVAFSYKLGFRIASLIDTLWGPADLGPFLIPGDSTNLLANAGFQATGAGGYSAGWSGTTVNNWFGFQDGAATVVLTPQATPGQTNLREIQLTITTSAAATVQIFQDPISGVVAGDRLVGAAEVEIVGTPVNLIQAQTNLYALVGGVTSFSWPLFHTPGYDPSPPSSSWPLIAMTQYSPETPPLLVGSGVQTNLRFGLNVSFRGAGSATVKFRKPYVKKVAAGYQS